jgi:IS4 transposase
MFDWAKFRATKGAAKLHLLLDHDGHLPCFARITEGKVADVTVAQQLKLPKGSLLVMDRGYNDYRLFSRWTTEGVGFVTRLKKNALWTSHEERPVKPGGKIRRDVTGRFFDFDANRRIETEFRRVTVWIEEKGEEMELLTNRFDLSAETIAEIYKQRW